MERTRQTINIETQEENKTMNDKWRPPKHGDKSKYIHIRLISPTVFVKGTFRTIDLGGGLKQVYGSIKGTNRWKAQNIMIPRSKIEQHGTKLTIKNSKLKQRLKGHGIILSKVKHLKTGGSADFVHPMPRGAK